MKGFPERFDQEIRTIADNSAKNADINVHANLNRKNAAWIGGSMLASMSTFNDICLTQAAYTDSGETEKATAILKQSVY
jgi:actin-related protein